MERNTTSMMHGSSSRSPRRFTGFTAEFENERATEMNMNWLSNMTEDQIRKKKAFVWAWGKNKNGELSLGVTKDSLMPRSIKGLSGKIVTYIASGGSHSA